MDKIIIGEMHPKIRIIKFSVEFLEILKKAAFKKYHRRAGYRWLSVKERQDALLNIVLEKGKING